MRYSDNEVDVDPHGLPLSVELKETSQHTAPTRGAVVRLKYATEGGGHSMIIRAKTAAGAPLPFGAEVTDANGQSVGTVAQGGRVVVRGAKADSGEFSVKWGDAANQQCKMSYVLPKATDGKPTTWTVVDSVCSE